MAEMIVHAIGLTAISMSIVWGALVVVKINKSNKKK